MMIKGSIQQEDVIFINFYAPNIGAPKYLKQILTDLKGEMDSNAMIAGDYNIPFMSIDRSFTQKIYKETSALNDMFEQPYIEHSIQKQQNTHSFQVCIEHFPG